MLGGLENTYKSEGLLFQVLDFLSERFFVLLHEIDLSLNV